ncbi:MAG: FRG domain-containing protein [Gallionellaceae bacterium]|nr:FRG domain-containing protein [Gallionellaceae bacterium]
MNNPKPSCSLTKVDDFGHTWLPFSFQDFLQELAHLATLCTGASPLPLYRGHADSAWLLESTFARSCKKFILGLDPSDRIGQLVQESVEYHRVVLNILLLKYGVIIRPTNEDAAGHDAWHELMRDLQQYPQRDHHHFQGTFYLDWTRSPDVAIFFTNLDRRGDGALWVCDAGATGKTRQNMQVGQIFDLMNQRCNKLNPDPPGCPLLFHPKPQTPNQRALRQQAEYVAQMDLRYDLASAWSSQEVDRNSGDHIYVKLILPNGTQKECSSYLMRRGMTESWLFPGEDDRVEEPTTD